MNKVSFCRTGPYSKPDIGCFDYAAEKGFISSIHDVEETEGEDY